MFNVPVANEDSSAIIVQAKKNIDGTVVVIGSGFAGIAGEEGFQRIKVDIEYEDDEVRSTDTIVVMVISSSNVPEDEEIFGATDDNAIYVDQMSLYVSEESSGIHSIEKADLGIEVYPNPATSQVNFRNEKVKKRSVEYLRGRRQIDAPASFERGVSILWSFLLILQVCIITSWWIPT
ncbi:MAG: hypothetical protein KL787_01915 [Taibaiella sp.]|nr:hypothetical protein [Taibaiella sp.]